MPDVSHVDYTVIDVPVSGNDIFVVHVNGMLLGNVTVVLFLCWRDCVANINKNWFS